VAGVARAASAAAVAAAPLKSLNPLWPGECPDAASRARARLGSNSAEGRSSAAGWREAGARASGHHDASATRRSWETATAPAPSPV
jgi:hypothetical protein